MNQWEQLKSTLESCGAKVEVMESDVSRPTPVTIEHVISEVIQCLFSAFFSHSKLKIENWIIFPHIFHSQIFKKCFTFFRKFKNVSKIYFMIKLEKKNFKICLLFLHKFGCSFYKTMNSTCTVLPNIVYLKRFVLTDGHKLPGYCLCRQCRSYQRQSSLSGQLCSSRATRREVNFHKKHRN